MNPAARIKDLFAKFLQRQTTRQEVEEMINLLKDGQIDDELKNDMLSLWRQTDDSDFNYEVSWSNMYDNIMKSDPPTRHNKKNNVITWRYSSVAAALMIVFAGYYLYHYQKGEVKPEISTLATSAASEIKAESKQTIYLSDGSTVILNEGSKLKYPPRFLGKCREVFLTGEAFFDIRSDKKHPFLVHTGKITTTVLGTSFNIKAYRTEDTIAITVISGKVKVTEELKELAMLVENQQINYSKQSERYFHKTVKTDSVIAWKPAGIYIRNETMEAVMQSLMSRFKVNIYFDNPKLKVRRLTASFSEEDSLEEILTVVCSVIDAEFKWQGNKITISGKGHSN